MKISQKTVAIKLETRRAVVILTQIYEDGSSKEVYAPFNQEIEIERCVICETQKVGLGLGSANVCKEHSKD